MAREQPPQQAPPVQRLRVRYAKRGRLRFTSHRDFSRAFERAVVRARVPMAYSSGFNPHPRISYAGAAPTGSASEAEFLELAMSEVVEPGDVHAALDRALPPGLDIVQVVDAAGPGTPRGALAELLEGSRWLVEVVAPEPDVRAAVTRFLAETSVVVERMTKKGMREFDCRAAVLALDPADPEESGRPVALDLVLRHGVPAVRPDDVLAGLRHLGLEVEGTPLLTRLAQGPLVDGPAVGDPLHA